MIIVIALTAFIIGVVAGIGLLLLISANHIKVSNGRF
jgi:hypothetical protein